MKTLKARLPSRQELLPVFAVFIFFSFSWALYRMFWYIPSWLEYMNIWMVLTIGAYVLAFALIESVLMTAGVVLFALLFPVRLFKEKYVLQGTSLAALVSVAAVLLQRKINLVYRLELWQLAVYPVLFLAALTLFVLAGAFIFGRLLFISRLVAGLAERITIFAYIYVPLSLVGFIVILIRNLVGLKAF